MLHIENEAGVILAYLNNTVSGSVSEEMNGIYALDFAVTIDHLKTDYLYDKTSFLNWNDTIFYVTDIEELHDSDDSVTVAISCEHISYKIMNNEFEKFNKVDITPREAMLLALVGTPFEVGVCELTDPISIQCDTKCNGKQILLEIVELTKGELQFDNRVVNLYKQRGTNRGTGFIFGKNLSSVKRKVSMVDDKVSYDVEVTETPDLHELGYYEVGDTVRVIDERLNIDVQMRIISVEKDIVTGMNNRVELGDKIDDIQNSFDKVKDDIQKVDDFINVNSPNWDKIGEITDDAGNVVIGKLNSITSIANKIVNSTGTFEHRDNALYWQDQPTMENSTFATLWSAKGIVFANEKTLDGEWIWQTALDAEGLTANKVTANALFGMLIKAADIVGSNITGGTITGVTIDGSTVMAGDIRVDGTITWNQDSSPVKAQYSIDGTSNWHSVFNKNDIFARYSYDGGITWTEAVKVVGSDGTNGVDGTDGRTLYTWVKYAKDQQGNGMWNSIGQYQVNQLTVGIDALSNITVENLYNRTYFGQAYNKGTPIASDDPSEYEWARIVGYDGTPGKPGTDGTNGTNGTDGKDAVQYYTWYAYADTITGGGFSLDPTGKPFMGIQYNSPFELPSGNPADYIWIKIKGENGMDANVPVYIKETHIDSVTIKSPTIEGNVVNAGVIQGGYIRGTTIEGATVYGGNVNDVYAKLSPTDPLAVYRPSGKVGEIWGATDGSSYLILYDRNGADKITLKSGASSTSISDFRDRGSMDMHIDGTLNITGQSGFNIYAWNRTSTPYMELFRSYMNVGNHFIETYIDGSKVYISNLSARVISELEVQNMELQATYQKSALQQSELEVTLMERGVL